MIFAQQNLVLKVQLSLEYYFIVNFSYISLVFHYSRIMNVSWILCFNLQKELHNHSISWTFSLNCLEHRKQMQCRWCQCNSWGCRCGFSGNFALRNTDFCNLYFTKVNQFEFILYYKLWCKTKMYVVLTFILFCSVGSVALNHYVIHTY